MLDRRSFLLGGVAALGLAFAAEPRGASAAGGLLRKPAVIGFSRAGKPLMIDRLGNGRHRVLVLGGQHGAPEANTVELARRLLGYFAERPHELPAEVGLDVMTVANPDGLAAGVRRFASGVDPNRNWGGPDWQADAFDSSGREWPGLGGPSPFSERETRALARWVTSLRPSLVVNYHSAGGFIQASRLGPAGELAALYADASGYWWPPDDVDPFGYPVTGSMDAWLTSIGLANIFVELTTYEDVDFEPHLAGLRATLSRLAAPPRPSSGGGRKR